MFLKNQFFNTWHFLKLFDLESWNSLYFKNIIIFYLNKTWVQNYWWTFKYKSFSDRRYETEILARDSYKSSFQSLLILAKIFKDTFVKNPLFDLLLCHLSLKPTKNSLKLALFSRSVEKFIWHTLAIVVSCKMVCYLDNHQVWLICI